MKKNNTKKIIPIFFAVDDNYAPFLASALESLKEHANPQKLYEINILTEALSHAHEQCLMSIAGENIKISFYNITQKAAAICSRLQLRDYYTAATYFRFFIPDMFPQYEKGLYLDCDIIITRDVADLYSTRIGSALVAAVNDEIINDIDVFGSYSEAVLGIPRSRYFNAGILVMNLSEMRKMRIEEVFADMISQKTYSVAQDQDYLNVICKNRVKLLDGMWNKTPMPYADRGTIPYIAHYKINFKPWKYDGIVYGELFWKYAQKTPYYSSLLAAKNAYTDEEKAEDTRQYSALEQLAERETYAELLSQSKFFGDDFFPLEFFIDSDSGLVLQDGGAEI